MKKALLFMGTLVIVLCGLIFGIHQLTHYFTDTSTSEPPDVADEVLTETDPTTDAEDEATFSPQMSLRDGDLSPVAGGQDVTVYEYPRHRDCLPIDDSMELTFASGAGAWVTGLTLHEDGSFEGQFHDSDMTTVYYCNFSGYFTDISQLDDHSYSLTLGELVAEDEVDETFTDGEITYISSYPYGMDGGTEFMFYLPETPVEELSEELLSWWPGRYGDTKSTTLGWYGLCNMAEEQGFFGGGILE